eukprot:scaffold111118_cov51-Prasinocladus_malaysianus.AAC.1
MLCIVCKTLPVAPLTPLEQPPGLLAAVCSAKDEKKDANDACGIDCNAECTQPQRSMVQPMRQGFTSETKNLFNANSFHSLTLFCCPVDDATDGLVDGLYTKALAAAEKYASRVIAWIYLPARQKALGLTALDMAEQHFRIAQEWNPE